MAIYFDHEKLEVYQVTIEFVAWSEILLEDCKGKAASAKKHLEEASSSIPNNIAEHSHLKMLVVERCTLIIWMCDSIELGREVWRIHLFSPRSEDEAHDSHQTALAMLLLNRFEDHPLRNGVHFADYIRRADVPGSKFAFALGRQQIRYLAVYPRRKDFIREIEFLKGDDESAPMIMAVTVETESARLDPLE